MVIVVEGLLRVGRHGPDGHLVDTPSPNGNHPNQVKHSIAENKLATSYLFQQPTVAVLIRFGMLAADHCSMLRR